MGDVSFSAEDRDRDLCRVLVEAHEHIERYLLGLKVQDFLMQEMVQDAVTMRLQQVLECANKLSPEIRSQLPIHWPSLAAMRNKISHTYDEVDRRVIWTVVRELEEFRRLIEFARGKV